MTSSEIRIGNKLKRDGLIITANARTIFEFDKFKYEPVRLTTTILQDIGFIRSRGYFRQMEIESDYGATIQAGDLIDTDKETLKLKDCDDGDIGKPIEYLHQLQNLYFALTGTELKCDI